jgi:hypothetical protein
MMLPHAPRSLPSVLLPVLLFAAAAGGGGCSSGGGGAIPDAGPHDAVFEVALNLPDGCPSGVANEKGIGRPCTKGGGECGSNLNCSCDPFLGIQLEGVPCFCTQFNLTVSVPDGGMPCDQAPASYCGTATSCCSYMSVGYYCLPNVCLADSACPQVSGP